MAKLGNEAGKLGNNIGNLASSIAGSPKGMIDQLTGKNAVAAAETVGKSGTPLLLRPFKWAAKGGLWVVEQPFAYGMKAVNWSVKTVGTAYKKAPVLMVPLTVIGGVAAYRGHQHRKHEREMRAEKEQQMAAIQTAMIESHMQPQQAQPQTVTNNNYQITPQEAAILEARMKGNGSPTTGHADNVVASREAASVQQPTAAL